MNFVNLSLSCPNTHAELIQWKKGGKRKGNPVFTNAHPRPPSHVT